MNKIIFFFVFSALLISCGDSTAPVKSETVVTRRDLDSEVIKTVAKMSIQGMMCAEGCGGKIQQDLQALPGVITTDLEFVENSAENTMKVEYDTTLINENALIECVQKIADGKYRVSTVEILHYHGLQNKSVTNGAAV